MVTVPVPIKQKYRGTSVSCGSWDDYTNQAAPQLSYDLFNFWFFYLGRWWRSLLILRTLKTVILPHFLHLASTWPLVSSYTVIALWKQYGHFMVLSFWDAIAIRARTIFCCISCDGSWIRIFFFMPTPPKAPCILSRAGLLNILSGAGGLKGRLWIPRMFLTSCLQSSCLFAKAIPQNSELGS